MRRLNGWRLQGQPGAGYQSVISALVQQQQQQETASPAVYQAFINELQRFQSPVIEEQAVNETDCQPICDAQVPQTAGPGPSLVLQAYINYNSIGGIGYGEVYSEPMALPRYTMTWCDAHS